MVTGSSTDLETVWKIREESIYPDFFGEMSRGIFPLSSEVFASYEVDEIDPRWLTHGVFEFGPTASRDSWLYVTSGYSNPWELDPNDYDMSEFSGSGVEFLMETNQQANWAIKLLLRMLAFDMLLAAGRIGAGAPLGLNDRIPLRAPVDGREESMVRNLIVAEPTKVPHEFKLPSGKVGLLELVGVTDPELAFAKANSTFDLVEILKSKQSFPTTVPNRVSVV